MIGCILKTVVKMNLQQNVSVGNSWIIQCALWGASLKSYAEALGLSFVKHSRDHFVLDGEKDST